jgi:hypothetical protein
MTTNRFLKSLIFWTIVFPLLACAAPSAWTAPVFGSPVPTSTLYPTIYAPTQTQTPTPKPSPTPDYSWVMKLKQNGLTENPADYEATIRNYYQPSPDAFRGYTTRYGAETLAEDVFWKHTQEMLDQIEHTNGFTYLGGGSGYVNFSGKQFLLDNRNSSAWSKVVEGTLPDNWSLNGNQKDFLRELETLGVDGSEDMKPIFLSYVRSQYDFVIATKSPNDFGFSYCVGNALHPERKNWRVVVGDFAAQQDWTPYAPGDVTDSHVHLGQRIYLDDAGSEWQWAADVPDELYHLLLENDAALITLLNKTSC